MPESRRTDYLLYPPTFALRYISPPNRVRACYFMSFVITFPLSMPFQMKNIPAPKPRPSAMRRTESGFSLPSLFAEALAPALVVDVEVPPVAVVPDPDPPGMRGPTELEGMVVEPGGSVLVIAVAFEDLA